MRRLLPLATRYHVQAVEGSIARRIVEEAYSAGAPHSGEPIAKLPSDNWDCGNSRLAMIARRVFCKPALDQGAVDAMHWQFLDAVRLCGASSVSNWAAHGSRSDDQPQELIAGQRENAEHQMA